MRFHLAFQFPISSSLLQKQEGFQHQTITSEAQKNTKQKQQQQQQSNLKSTSALAIHFVDANEISPNENASDWDQLYLTVKSYSAKSFNQSLQKVIGDNRLLPIFTSLLMKLMVQRLTMLRGSINK